MTTDDGRTTIGWRMPAYSISSPMSLRLRWAKNRLSLRGIELTNVWSGVQRHNHSAVSIRLHVTSPCIEDPLASHFYIVKLGFTRVYISLLFHTNRLILSTILSSMWIIFKFLAPNNHSSSNISTVLASYAILCDSNVSIQCQHILHKYIMLSCIFRVPNKVQKTTWPTWRRETVGSAGLLI